MKKFMPYIIFGVVVLAIIYIVNMVRKNKQLTNPPSTTATQNQTSKNIIIPNDDVIIKPIDDRIIK